MIEVTKHALTHVLCGRRLFVSRSQYNSLHLLIPKSQTSDPSLPLPHLTGNHRSITVLFLNVTCAIVYLHTVFLYLS